MEKVHPVGKQPPAPPKTACRRSTSRERVLMKQEQQELQVQAWAQTDVGQQRKHNEDNYLVDMELEVAKSASSQY